ncbi:MAG: alpha/beta hydrolase family esterase [Candidatus Limnocylindrales bacterium]
MTGTASYTFDHGGLSRTYNLHVPKGLNTSEPVPLLIELHGGGGSGNRIDGLTGFFAIGDREGVVVAAPSGTNGSWNDGREETEAASGGADDVGFIAQMIDRIESQVAVDSDRVYVTGMSNGAMMSGRLACQLSDRIAAIGQVAGTASVAIARDCRPPRPVPVLEIHGTADRLVPYMGGTVVPRLGGGRGQVVSVDAWAAFWAANNAAALRPAATTIGTDTTRRTWSGPTPQSDIVFYRVEGAGHTWPDGRQYLRRLIIGSTTRSFDASEVIWRFLAGHRLGAGPGA